jgi:20S proteasome subunit beta 1
VPHSDTSKEFPNLAAVILVVALRRCFTWVPTVCPCLTLLPPYSLEKGGQPETPVAANILNQLCYGNKNHLMAGMICAGWDKRNGGQVYSIPLGGGVFREAYTIGGSGSGYIYGYCDTNFRKGMSKKEAQEFVKNAVSLAMWRDGSSGGVIRTVTISKDGVEREMIEGDKLPHLAAGWAP